jgi:hypothetical protein
MNKYPNHGYVVSQLLDCGVDKLVMLKQNYVDMMTQHRPKGICNVNYTRSSHSIVIIITQYHIHKIICSTCINCNPC